MLVGISVLAVFFVLSLIEKTECISAFGEVHLPMNELLFFVIGIELTLGLRMIKYRKLIQSQEKLEEVHINETDERNQLIQFKSSQLCLRCMIVFLAIGWLITVFFNEVVAYTLAGSMLITCFVYLLIKIYYEKKM